MQASNFKQANVNMGPPEGVSEDDCGTLRVFKGPDIDGQPIIISRWKPTQKEIDALQQGGSVWLTIWGGRMPPVSVNASDPWS